MYKIFNLILIALWVTFAVIGTGDCQSSTEGDWYLDGIHAPLNIEPVSKEKQIVIAVVDDAVRTTHRDLAEFIWNNPYEIADNKVDDDGNGYVDDIQSWDAADGDNTVSPPRHRLNEFYHGTHVAGIIAKIARRAYGDRATDLVRILPVKTLSDHATDTYLKKGYKGVEYAIRAGAHIVVCAWGVGTLSAEETRILRKAREKDILIVGAAGNFPQEQAQYPAAFESVLAVASLNENGVKTKSSNFGDFVDLSAPGVNITSAGTLSDTDYQAKDGTSAATTMAAMGAGIVKLQNPTYSFDKVVACLKSAAEPVEADHDRYGGKLGAGSFHVEKAVACPLFNRVTKTEIRLAHPQGYLRLHRPEGKTASWSIEPLGPIEGFRFRLLYKNEPPGQGKLYFYSSESPHRKALSTHMITAFPGEVYIPGNTAYVTYETDGATEGEEWALAYRADTAVMSKRYCRDTVYVTEEGLIEDGSGANHYSFNTDCKWQITAPEGKVIKFRFSEFDTEARIDFIYFFNGAGTHEKIMALFSGSHIPPELTSWTNQVLMWFVTNDSRQGKGWKAEIKFVDPPER